MLTQHIQENLPGVTRPFSTFCTWAWYEATSRLGYL